MVSIRARAPRNTRAARALRAAFTTLMLVWLLAPAPAIGQASPRTSKRLAIAAASDLQSALPELVKAFEKQAPATVAVSFGSSGTLFAQIQNGAPFDLFFSADVEYPRQLIARGHADASTLYEYAKGRIVVWTRRDSGIDVARGLDALTDRRVTRIAIANPALAPYGRAAVAALRQKGLYDQVQSKLVRGDNISQTAQLVESGNADVGILALSLALGPASAIAWHLCRNPRQPASADRSGGGRRERIAEQSAGP